MDEKKQSDSIAQKIASDKNLPSEPQLKVSDSLKKVLEEKKKEQQAKEVQQADSSSDLVRKGFSQFNPMPSEQEFTPPEQNAQVANTPLPTQPQPVQTPAQEKKLPFEIKLVLLIMALLFLSLIAISATLHYTNYTVYTPPKFIVNLVEAVFAKLPI